MTELQSRETKDRYNWPDSQLIFCNQASTDLSWLVMSAGKVMSSVPDYIKNDSFMALSVLRTFAFQHFQLHQPRCIAIFTNISLLEIINTLQH